MAACEFSVNDVLSGERSFKSIQPPNGLNGMSLQQISALMSAELQRHNQDILGRIDGRSSQISVITQRTEMISSLSSQVNEIDVRVSSLEETNEGAAATFPRVNLDNLAGEIQHRICRSKNFFIYGLMASQCVVFHQCTLTYSVLQLLALTLRTMLF